jgi:hypothetical protein
MTKQERIDYENKLAGDIRKAVRKSYSVLRKLPYTLAPVLARYDSKSAAMIVDKVYNDASNAFLEHLIKG